MNGEYQSAIDYLYHFTDYEVQSGYVYSPDRFDLARVERLLALLDHPQRSFRAVHVAGTKGKGSTSAMIASILRHAGYHTGFYSSPHLHTFRERIQIDGECISRKEVIAGVERLRAVAPQVPEITTFELITALAFDHFARCAGTASSAEREAPCPAEWAVLEVGMGGRLDATNVVTPEVSVITSISYDHMLYLGDTLAEIAGEKAGIIKPGVPVVSAPQPEEALQAIQQVCAEKEAPLTLVGRDWQWESAHVSTQGQRFWACPTADRSARTLYSLPLLGRHQQVNATVALAAVDQLRVAGVDIPVQATLDGLESVRWPGRLEILGRHPWVIVDGAHNGDSMLKLRATIDELFAYKELILIFGIFADKDVSSMLDAILPAAARVLVTQSHHPRAAQADSIVEQIAARGGQARAVSLDQALDEALSVAGNDDLICATGSLNLVAELRAAWFRHIGQPLPPSDAE